MSIADLQEGTIAELLEQFGDIPPHCVLLKPTPGTATEKDVLQALALPRKRMCELVDGTLVEKRTDTEKAILGSYLASLLWKFVEEHDLGMVMGGDGSVRLAPGNVRCPDVSYIPWDSLPADRKQEKIWTVTPALAVEGLSESNTPREIDRKLKELLAAGCALVWIIDPKNTSARAHTSAKRFKELDETGVLDGGKVLPGFKLPLADLFNSARRRRKKPH